MIDKDIHDDELVAYYNHVEETVITLFGSYESAAAYFDWRGSLDSLWAYTKEHYVQGWSASHVAREWFDKNVGQVHFTGDPKTVKPPKPATKMAFEPGVKIISVTDYSVKPAVTTVTSHPSPSEGVAWCYSANGQYIEIEKDILAARAARAKRWKKSA